MSNSNTYPRFFTTMPAIQKEDFQVDDLIADFQASEDMMLPGQDYDAWLAESPETILNFAADTDLVECVQRCCQILGIPSS